MTELLAPDLPQPAFADIVYERPEPGVLRAVYEPIDAPGPLPEPECNSTLWLYRDRTTALLRRYMRISIEVGRMPSLLGREFFRSRVTSYRSHTFADAVIFVLDIEHALDKLTNQAKTLIGMIVLQEYTREEAAAVMGCSRRTVHEDYGKALDMVTELFLERGILARLPNRESNREKSCQGGSDPKFAVTPSYETE
jgi:sigma-70-like protein